MIVILNLAYKLDHFKQFSVEKRNYAAPIKSLIHHISVYGSPAFNLSLFYVNTDTQRSEHDRKTN